MLAHALTILPAHSSLVLVGLLLSFGLSLFFVALHRLLLKRYTGLIRHRDAHTLPTSRLGGVAACLAVVVSLAVSDLAIDYVFLLFCFPILAIGIFEDLGWQIKPRIRLLIAFLASLSLVGFEQIGIKSISIPFLDLILSSSSMVAFTFTAICIVVLVNAVNFIDGVHGLSSGKVLIVLFSLCVLSYHYNEPNLLAVSLAAFGAILGLFMINFPMGRIFMGDAGAYSMGFVLAVLLITIQHRHPEISPWAIVLIIQWPITEMIHSIVRRRYSGKRADRPDKMHMHHVIMRSLTILSKGHIRANIANPLATVIILPLALLPVICGLIFREQTEACMILFFAFIAGFSALHFQLTRLSRKR